jgi:hypothetical protein
VTRDPAYRIKQDGMIVARTEGADDTAVWAQIGHYARQYVQDGPLQIQRRDPMTGRWLVYDNWR